MLGFRQILLLVLAILPVMFSPIFGETEITVNFNQSEYQTGDLLEISGSVSEFSMPVIAMSIYDPDGIILTANNLEIDSEDNFSKILVLDAPFYEKSGQYTVKLDYAQTTHEEHFAITNDSELVLEEVIVPEIVLLTTDKPIYTNNDVITITGLVSTMESPTVLVGVYDPFGTPAGFYFGQIDSNFEFTVDFLAKAGVNFKTDGTYSIKAHYAESEETVTFDFFETLDVPNETIEEPTAQETIEQPITDETTEESKINQPNTTNKTDTSQTNQIDDTITEPPVKETSDDMPIDETINTDNSIINNDIKQKIDSNDSIINNEKKPEVVQKEPKPIPESNPKQQTLETPKDFDNLSVEDIELGKLLNQINLNCDPSTFIDTITYYDGMGPALYRLCNWESSLDSFDAALVDDPNNVEIISNKGSALAKLGYYFEAIKHYDQALKIDSTFIPAINNKANILANLGQTEDAIYLYAQVIQENPNYITARKNMAIALSQQSAQDEIVNVILSDPNEEELQEIIKEPVVEQITEQKETNFIEQIQNALYSLFGFLN